MAGAHLNDQVFAHLKMQLFQAVSMFHVAVPSAEGRKKKAKPGLLADALDLEDVTNGEIEISTSKKPDNVPLQVRQMMLRMCLFTTIVHACCLLFLIIIIIIIQIYVFVFR